MNIDELPVEADPIHLMIVGDTKTGKSTYLAEAARAGFNVIWVDSDNGLSAIRYVLKDDPVARSRIHYFPTSKPMSFIKGFLRSTTAQPFRWVRRTDSLWGPLAVGVLAEDEVWSIDQTKIPKGFIFGVDTWTSTAADSLGIGRADQKAELLEGTNQGIYGEANANLLFICNMLQKVPYHVVVQAHGTKYEEYEKPTGVVAGQMKQGQMVLKSTTDVPLSSSRPNGKEIASRFNHIGWLDIDGLGETTIDFTRKPNRVGGGPPNKKAKTKDLSFLKLAGGLSDQTLDTGWYTKTTHGALTKK